MAQFNASICIRELGRIRDDALATPGRSACPFRCSDGTMTPEEVIRQADLAGLDVFSLTDHDTVAVSSPRWMSWPALNLPSSSSPGPELTCYDAAGREWHMLAYGFDHRNPRVTAFLMPGAGAGGTDPPHSGKIGGCGSSARTSETS
jgi:hypothetical protein